MIKTFRLLAPAALWLCLGAAAWAGPFNLVQNGSFEDPQITANFVTYNVGQSIGGWTVGGAGVDLIRGYWHAKDGAQSIDLNALNAGSLMRQDLVTVKGQ